MGKLSGTVLILAGISLAVYTLSSRHEETAQVTVARAPVGAGGLAGPAVEAGAPAARAARTSETAPKEDDPPVLATPAGGKTAAAPVQPAEAAAPLAPPLSTAAAPPRAASRTPPRGATIVRIEEAPLRMPVGEPAAAAGPPLDRPALTREIQRHLKRVGCYKGEVTGTWDPAVRQAMKALTDRVNAALPIDQPDPVLLAMVQNQAPGTCNAPCPAGEAKALDGRCLPTALIAQTGKLRAPAAAGDEHKAGDGRERKKAPAVARFAPAETAAPGPAEGRMSLAGPVAPRTRAAVSPAPARVRAHRGTTSQGYTSRRTSIRPRSSTRSANVRARGRYRAAQRQSPGMSGFSAWFFPF